MPRSRISACERIWTTPKTFRLGADRLIHAERRGWDVSDDGAAKILRYAGPAAGLSVKDDDLERITALVISRSYGLSCSERRRARMAAIAVARPFDRVLMFKMLRLQAVHDVIETYPRGKCRIVLH
jgi:hypothetical protein